MSLLRKTIFLLVATFILGVAEGWFMLSDGIDLSYEVAHCDFQDDENFDILAQSPQIDMMAADDVFCAIVPIQHIEWLMADEASEGVSSSINLPLRAPPVVG